MEWSSSSFEVVEVSGVDRITDRNASPWQRHPQFQRWKAHVQRLGRALEKGDLQQASIEFDALVNDLPEFGQLDPMAHPEFDAIGKAIRSHDLIGAREAFTRLENEVPSLHLQHQTQQTQTMELLEEDASESDPPGILDVTA